MAGFTAYVGLGSNLDESAAHIRTAFNQLAQLVKTELMAQSRLYRTAPQGPEEPQPDYVNAVAQLATDLSARELLEAFQAIENQHGRDRSVRRWAPRTLDLDLLLYGDEVIDEPGLQVPHLRMAERRFVLRPLLDIAPNLEVPGKGSVRDLLEQAPPARVEPWNAKG